MKVIKIVLFFSAFARTANGLSDGIERTNPSTVANELKNTQGDGRLGSIRRRENREQNNRAANNNTICECYFHARVCKRLLCPYPDDTAADRHMRMCCWAGISVLAGAGIAVTVFLLK